MNNIYMQSIIIVHAMGQELLESACIYISVHKHGETSLTTHPPITTVWKEYNPKIVKVRVWILLNLHILQKSGSESFWTYIFCRTHIADLSDFLGNHSELLHVYQAIHFCVITKMDECQILFGNREKRQLQNKMFAMMKLNLYCILSNDYKIYLLR